MPQVCLHCMKGFVVGGRCRICGKPSIDIARQPNTLPFGYRLVTAQGRCYQIGNVLGIGGFGITYLAWDAASSRPVAVKELFPNRLSRNMTTMEVKASPEQQAMFQHFKRRFMDEARIISYLKNEPEIVNIYDYFETNGTGYYAMEYLQGMDMQHWLEKKGAPMTWYELQSPVKQVMRGLKALHGYGLLHRDISPDNIFGCNDGVVKLIDFGSVRNANADHFTTVLKRGFAPLELFMEKGNQGFWTDTFSLCATIYYLLSGKLPAQVYDRLPQIKEKGVDPLVPISQYAPNLPPYVAKAIMYGLQLDETKRFQNIDEMHSAFFPEVSREQRPARVIRLNCVGGLYTDKWIQIPLGGYISLGRGGSNGISYPADTPGISRRHCVFYAHNSGRLFLQDQESTNGTYLDNRRVEPMKWYEIRPGHVVRIGREIFTWKTGGGGAK